MNQQNEARFRNSGEGFQDFYFLLCEVIQFGMLTRWTFIVLFEDYVIAFE